MPKRESKLVGSGITAQTVHYDVIDGQHELAELLNKLRQLTAISDEPWGQFAPIISAARRRFDEINAELANCDPRERASHFRERDSEAWYIRQIVKTARFVELEIEGGRCWVAATGAMEIGELFAELRLKHWDAEASFGAKTRNQRAEGGRNGRRRSAKVRRSIVELYKKEGHSVRRACQLASEDYGDSWQTYRRDYYLKETV